MGHISRNCPQNAAPARPAAGGDSPKRTFFAMAPTVRGLFASTVSVNVPQEVVHMRVYPAGVDSFVGLLTTVGTALMDPGAQDGCVGQIAFSQLEKRLGQLGLKCKMFDPPTGATCGGVTAGAASAGAASHVSHALVRTASIEGLANGPARTDARTRARESRLRRCCKAIGGRWIEAASSR